MKISIYIVFSITIIVFIVGVAFGYYLTPQYQFSMYEKTSMDLGSPDRWVDSRYINAMIAHHRVAMLLAEQATKEGVREEIKNLASDILQNEPKLIDELYDWKEEWYKDSRRVRDPFYPKLGTSDDTFDLRFLNALIAHHDDGVRMTKEIRTKSSRSEILDNADAVESFLLNTGAVLREWRKNWYSI